VARVTIRGAQVVRDRKKVRNPWFRAWYQAPILTVHLIVPCIYWSNDRILVCLLPSSMLATVTADSYAFILYFAESPPCVRDLAHRILLLPVMIKHLPLIIMFSSKHAAILRHTFDCLAMTLQSYKFVHNVSLLWYAFRINRPEISKWWHANRCCLSTVARTDSVTIHHP